MGKTNAPKSVKQAAKMVPGLVAQGLIDEAISAVQATLALRGFESFMLIFRTSPTDIQLRLEKMGIKDGIDLPINALKTAVKLEIQKNPDHSREYVEVLERFVHNIELCVKAANDDFAALPAALKPKAAKRR